MAQLAIPSSCGILPLTGEKRTTCSHLSAFVTIVFFLITVRHTTTCFHSVSKFPPTDAAQFAGLIMTAKLTVIPGALAPPQVSQDAIRRKPKLKRKKRASGGNTSRGWGPFQSVLKERSVDFNLTLDVQNLQQQVQDLTTLRDVLSTRTLLRRHSPEGSLFHVVKEYLRVFRCGWAVQEAGRKRLLDEQDQRAFLHSVMDPQLDVGNGLRGPDVMAEQIILYSTFIKFVSVSMTAYDIVVADDSVVIKTQAKLRFQVLRNTIESIFPHVIGDECLVAQLVGQEVEPPVGITFSFNAEGRCCKYELDVDFVAAFASIVKDPRKLDKLLGRALIADNCMLGLLDEPLKQPGQSHGTFGDALVEEYSRVVDELNDLQHLAGDGSRLLLDRPLVRPSKPRQPNADEVFYRIVSDYYFVFAKGYQRGSKTNERVSADSQDAFINQAFVPERSQDLQAAGGYVKERWQALSRSFDVLGFQQTSTLPVQYVDPDDMCVVRSTADYTLRITLHTLESVFPHVLPYRPLVDTLLGSVLVVPSELAFSVETDTGRIERVAERMDFVAPMAALLPTREDLSFVMARALLSLDGVSRPPPLLFEEELWESSSSDATSEKPAANSRTMNMADILA
jgi:hypothetical protein